MFVIVDAVRVRVVGVYCTHMRPPGVPPYRTVVTKGHDRRRGTDNSTIHICTYKVYYTIYIHTFMNAPRSAIIKQSLSSVIHICVV